MGSTTSEKRIEVTESQLIGFELNRTLYYWIILIISVIATSANLVVIKTALFRKYKYLQKTCIISLALSDILSVVLFALNNLDMLGKKPMTWIYGQFMCHLIPIGQILGNLTSSIALLVIALDRYHNVIQSLSRKWNPPLWKCLGGAMIIWIICAGLSYPVAKFYIYIPIILDHEDSAICTGVPVTKSIILLYYGCMNALFFIPIVLMFFWFYYKIATLICRHIKPPLVDNSQEITETSCGTKTLQETSVSGKSGDKKKNVQMDRKIRSFKIVVTLIIAFIGCRMPYWLVMFYLQINVTDRNLQWNIRFSTICLYLFNCALNPFLYTFLNFTLIFWRKLNSFLTATCCCWFSDSEFKDFETGKPMAEGFVGINHNKPDMPKSTDLKVNFIDVPINAPKYTQKTIIY